MRGDSAPIATLFVESHGLSSDPSGRTFLLPAPILARAFARSRALTFALGPFVLLWLVLRSCGRADVLNPHNVPAPFVAAIAGWLRGRPIVWTCNEVPRPLPPDEARAVGRLDAAIWLVAGLAATQVSWAADEILVLSEKTRSDVRDEYRRDATVVRAGVDVAPFSAEPNPPRDQLTLLYVAKLHPQKDPQLAVRTLAEVRRRGVNATLTIVGSGPLGPAVVNLAARLGVAPFLRMEHDVDVPALVERYRTSRALLVTAGGHQSWGLTPFEAVAAGTPSVISDEVGAAEVLGPADAALVVPRTAKAFADAAIRLGNEAALGSRLVDNGRRLASTMSWAAYAAATRDAFVRAINHDHQRHRRVTALAGLVLAIVLGTYAAQLVFFFGRFPVPWPDETLYAEPALHLIRDRTLVSPLFEGPSVGAAQHAYWLLPGYFLLVAAAFVVGGPGLDSIRFISVLAGIATIGLTASLVRHVGGDRRSAAIAVGLLVLDPLFVRASLVGRTDLPALALALAALRLGLGGGIRSEVAAGFAAAGAVLVHPLGGVAFLLLLVRPVVGLRSRPAYVLAGAGVPLLPTAAFILQDPPSFVQQLGVQLDRKGARGAWDIWFALRVVVDQYGSGVLGASAALSWIAGGIGLLRSASRGTAGSLLVLGFLLELAAITLSAEMWYPVFVLPFAYAGLALAIGRVSSTHRLSVRSRTGAWRHAAAVSSLVAVCALLVIVDLEAVTYRWQATAPVAPDSYERWSRDIARTIPAGSRVLIGGAPDPAWVLLLERHDVRLRGLLNTPAALRYYSEHLEEVDYAVASGVLDPGWIELFTAHATTITDVTGAAGSTTFACTDGWTPCRALTVRIYQFSTAR